MTLFFAARSAKEEALLMSFSFLLFFASRIATSRFVLTVLLRSTLRSDTLNARFAVLVTGIV